MDARAEARALANRIADEHEGAWGGVMLQVDWLTDLIAERLQAAWDAGVEWMSEEP